MTLRDTSHRQTMYVWKQYASRQGAVSWGVVAAGLWTRMSLTAAPLYPLLAVCLSGGVGYDYSSSVKCLLVCQKGRHCVVGVKCFSLQWMSYCTRVLSIQWQSSTSLSWVDWASLLGGNEGIVSELTKCFALLFSYSVPLLTKLLPRLRVTLPQRHSHSLHLCSRLENQSIVDHTFVTLKGTWY